MLTGTYSLRTEGVDLTSAGIGEQQLAVDLTTAGSGTQRLDGVGGARGLASAPSGDGIATSAASGSSGGIVRVAGANTHATSTPTVTTTLGASAALSGNDIVVRANAIGLAVASAANSGGGLVSIGDANAVATVDAQGKVDIGASAQLDARHDLTLESKVTEQVASLSDTNGGGLVSFAKARARTTVDYRSELVVGSGAKVSAGERPQRQFAEQTSTRRRTPTPIRPASAPTPTPTTTARRGCRSAAAMR